jgi:hypothetical protein
MISNAAYDRRWPKASRSSFEGLEFDDDELWSEDEMTRICEYWYKEPATKTLVMLDNGKTIDKTKWDGAAQIVKERTIKCHKIMMCIASGDAILEGPTEWAGAEFPFVQIYGDWLVIDGKVYWYGLTRHSRGAQIAYNYTRTAITETIALAPQSKFWATSDQAKGHTDKWGEAHKKLFPFLLYNADAKTGGAPPQRMGGPDVPVALIQESQLSSEEIKATSGIFDNSLGQQGNETSGRAIAQRQRQGRDRDVQLPGQQREGHSPHLGDTDRPRAEDLRHGAQRPHPWCGWRGEVRQDQRTDAGPEDGRDGRTERPVTR